jgi:membrane protein
MNLPIKGGTHMSASPITNDVWGLFKDAGSQWMEHKAPRLGAALAYYTAFALAPLLVIVIAIVGLVFGRDAAMGQISGQIENVVGDDGAKAVESMVAGANHPASGIFATMVGIVMLLVGALGLFAQLQDALNTVWEVQPKPGRALLGFLRDRLLSFTMVLGTSFLLLVSLLVSAALAALGSLLGEQSATILGQILNTGIGLIVITFLFAMIYRFLPDVRIAWRDVWFGAVFTTLLFTVGKFLIGLYLGKTGTASTFGAAGSLAALLIWLYYSAQIFLFGAELTKAYADRFGSRIVPKDNAVAITEHARAQQGIPMPGQDPAKPACLFLLP